MELSSYSTKLTAQCDNTVIIFNDLDVDFEQSENSFNISNILCNRCTYASPNDQEICNCRNDCPYDEEILHSFNECNELCYENFGGFEYNYVQLNACYQSCNDEMAINVGECHAECGTYSQAPRVIVSWLAAVSFWFTTGFVASSEGDPDDVVISNLSQDPLPKNILLELDDVDVSNTIISYCYQTELLIQYEDGNCCLFIDFECFHRG